MRAQLKAICRGDSLTCLSVGVAGVAPSAEIAARATFKDGSELPCNCYRMKTQGDTPQVVIAVPLLFDVDMDVELSAREGADVQSCHLPLPNAAVKWGSRLTYRLRPEEAAAIRDFDERSEQQGIRLVNDFAVYDYENEELVIRINLLMPYHEDTQLECRTLDLQGRVAGEQPVMLGTAVHPSSFDPSSHMRISTVSVRVPVDTPGYVVTVRDCAHPQLVGFHTMLPYKLEKIRQKGMRYWHHAMLDPNYDLLFRGRRPTEARLEMQRNATFATANRFSIVVPLYKTPIGLFEEMVDSVVQQSYPNWELVLVNASPEVAPLAEAVSAAAAKDARIRFVNLPENLGITENTNFGIAASTGDFICFLDHDDTLEADALFEYACALEKHPDIDLMYCDEDKLNEDGTYYYAPYFKPDFDLALLRCNNYICHFLCIRKSLVDAIEPPTAEFDGAQDHNLTLRASESARRIHHVPKVLYHWRALEGSTAVNDRGAEKAKPYAHEAGALAIQRHLDRQGVNAVVEDGPVLFYHHVKYLVSGEPLVSIVIPNKDCPDYLTRCVDSVLAKTGYGNYEIVIVENNSEDPAMASLYAELEGRDERISVVTWPGEFNFSKIVNFGAEHAKGDYLLFLNNDTEVLSAEWLENMLGLCQQEDVGAVGARLLYPNMTVQHAGIIVPSQYEYALHEGIGTADEDTGYYGRSAMTHNSIAVTAACMLTKRSVFDAVGGFDEEFTVAYNDVDYCFKVRDGGWHVIYEPTARLIHYESVSRGFDSDSFDKRIRSLREASVLKARWAKLYVEGDPNFNPNLEDLFHLKWR